MKSQSTKSFLQPLCFLCVLCGSVLNCSALDREVFSFTNYDLNVQVDPDQHRLGVRGKITLRNDTATPQKIAVLQISSSLDWRAIKVADKTVQFVTQLYASDIDHTGALSEAIVTLPEAVPARGTLELEIAYEGVILHDATRLTRIGTPEEVAKSTDWDAIDPKFSAVRGAGYVAWYPIATEVANLSEGDSLFEVVARWKSRESGSTMRLKIAMPLSTEAEPQIIFNGIQCSPSAEERMGAGRLLAGCSPQPLRLATPTLLIADYQVTERPSIEIRFLRGHESAAVNFADAAEKAAPLIRDWFGAEREKAKTADLPDTSGVPFESGELLLTSLTNSDSAGLAATHQLTHASFLSFRPWIQEGLAHFAQALYIQEQKGRQAALDYMSLHRSALVRLEQTTGAQSENEADRSLVNTINEELYRSKAMCVWWMLRDMLGDSALKKALAAYRQEQDNEPSYLPRLIAALTQRDLEWFFDDWIYRDRGLPDFKIESAFSRKLMTGSFILTITLDNLGAAGAEVPILVKFAGGEVTKRLEVRAKNRATIRVETPGLPQEIVVNDGSVPESDTSNNNFKVEPTQN